MSMKSSSRQVNGITIIDISGRIVLGEPTSALRDLFHNLIQSGQKKALLNLSDVNYIDSSGLGALVSGYTSFAGQQGELKLFNLSSRVHDLLRLTKLLTVFEVFNDETTALQSFK